MRSLPVLGLILTGLIASGLVEQFSPLIRFALAFLLFSYVTGEVICSRLGVITPAGRTATAFLMGLSTHAIIVWLCSLLALSLGACCVVLLCSSFALFLIFAVIRRTGAPAEAKSKTPAIVLAVAALIGAFFVASPPPTSPEGDGYDHIGYVRTIMVEDDLVPAGVLAPVESDGRGESVGDPRKGAFHPLFAAMCRLSAVDPARAWRWLPAFLAPVAVLAFWRFNRMLLPSGAYAAASMVLFLMFQGGLGRDFFSTIAYGQHLSMIFYWVVFVAAVRYGGAPRWRSLIAIAVLLVGGALIHLDTLIHVGLAVAALVVFRKTFDMTGRGSWRLAATALLCAAVVLSWKLLTSYAPGNLMHLHAQGVLYFTDTLYVPSPIELLKKYGLLFVAGLGLLPGLLLVRRHRRHAWKCFALALPAIAVAGNPWLAPHLYERIGYLVGRFLLNVPVFPVTVLVLGSIVARARAAGIGVRIVAVVVLLVWGRFFVTSTTVWARDARTVLTSQPDETVAQARLSAWVKQSVPAGAVVVSDPSTSYWLSAFTPVKVIAVLHQHATPADRRVFERLADARNVMSPFTTQIEATAILRKYAADYVLVNGAGGASHGYMAEWRPGMADALGEKFGSLPGVYDLVYEQNGFLLYQVGDETPQEYGWFPTVPFMRPPPDGAVRCKAPDDSGAPRVTSVYVTPAAALPGEKIMLTVGYQRDREPESPMPLLLYVRFEDEDYFEHAATFPGDKFLRRYRERRHAAFYRFRFDHRPFAGLYAPEMWPLGLEVFETVEFRLPKALRETTYQIEVQLAPETLVPNFSIRDLLYNDDRYAGTPCGEIAIQRQVTR